MQWKIIGGVTVVLSVTVFIGGIMNLVSGGGDLWPYLVVAPGPFIWGVIQLTKRPKLLSLKLTDIGTFQKENCVGCQFADEDAMVNGTLWCMRPEPPEWNPKKLHCLDRSESTLAGVQTKGI